jgi:DNA repair photolyase
MIIKEVKAKSILVKSNLPEADYVINPYTGCMHGCIYCYARFMKRFTNHHEDWGKFVDVKINSADLIKGNIGKYTGKNIFISSVTDSYMSIDKNYMLSRKVLEKLSGSGVEISIQTKSHLVLRDIDLISKIKNIEVGFTITTLDDEVRKQIEPYASSVENRLNALKELHKSKIKNYVFIGPILPFITDWQEIILQTKDYVDRYMLENLNIIGSVWHNIEEWLLKNHEDLIEKYEQIYFYKNGYWDKVEKDIIDFCNDNKIKYKMFFHHKKQGKRNILK